MPPLNSSVGRSNASTRFVSTMTLIVARRTGNALTIVGDTHWTDVRSGLPVAALRGVIKSVVLAPHFTVSFAGDLRLAGEALITCTREWYWRVDRAELIKRFLAAHRECDGAIDFILAFDAPCELVCIKHGCARNVNSAWIGDFEAFEAFQKALLSPGSQAPLSTLTVEIDEIRSHSDAPPDLAQRMRRAMQEVISSASLSSVSGFPVVVGSTAQDLRYLEYVFSQTAPIDLEAIGDAEPMPLGTAAAGQYTFYFVFGHNGRACFPVLYFAEGGFGAAFGVAADGILRAARFRAASFEQFLAIVRDATNLRISTPLRDPEHMRHYTAGMMGNFRQRGDVDI
jgi:hypothetical protein